MSSITVHDQGYKAPCNFGDGRKLEDVTDDEIIRAVRKAQARIEQGVRQKMPGLPWPKWPR